MNGYQTTITEVDAVIASGKTTRNKIRRMITALTTRRDDCERFYPWPALAQSLQRDIESLQREHP